MIRTVKIEAIEDVYKRQAKLNVPPSHCIVVEDALHGIEAARAAGMKSIGVTRNGKPLPADLATHSLAELAPNAFDNLLLP